MLSFTAFALTMSICSMSISDSVLDSLFATDAASTISFYTDVLNRIDCGCARVSNLDVSQIKVYLYNFETNSNSSYLIDDAASEIFSRPNFNASQCIQIFVPGFKQNNSSNPSETSKCIFSKIKCDGIKPLALIIDHSEYTDAERLIENINLLGIYKKAVYYAKSIGVKIGEFLIQLLEIVDRSNIDIIGHSLGGQIVGYVGETVINNTGIPLERIFATDPAGPCYANCPNEHIKSDQAELVVVIHCNAGELGSDLNLAHYDFYSHNGQNQKGCYGGSSDNIALRSSASTCSHRRCVPISQIPSIFGDVWKAVKCSSDLNFLNDECADNESTLAGYRVTPTNSTGVYFFTPDEKLDCEIFRFFA